MRTWGDRRSPIRDRSTSATGSVTSENDGRVFRALVYNKGAVVLHMLRRLVGDEAFFRGLRRFYAESRFTKAGTDDFRAAMEAESGRSLERFFERWIYGSTLPQTDVQLSRRQAGGRAASSACCTSSRPATSSTCRSPSRSSTPTASR